MIMDLDLDPPYESVVLSLAEPALSLAGVPPANPATGLPGALRSLPRSSGASVTAPRAVEPRQLGKQAARRSVSVEHRRARTSIKAVAAA